MSNVPKERVFIGFGSGPHGKLVKLPDPALGGASSYLLRDGRIQEINWFKHRLTSWFVGNVVIEDGGVYLATPVDPLFLMLPILEQGRHATAEKPLGQFCPLEDILQATQANYPAVELLKDTVTDSLPLVCQVKGIGSDNYYRLDDERAVAWLACKVEQIMESLLNGEPAFAGMGKAGVRAYAVQFLSEWVSEQWLKRLRAAFGITQPAPTHVSQKAGSSSKWSASVEDEESIASQAIADSAPAKRPAAVQKNTPADKARQTKMAKLAKEAKGMSKMNSFFVKK